MNHLTRSFPHCQALRFGACLVILALVASGCAISRSQVALRTHSALNPASGTSVKIVQVNDRRTFQVNPRQPSIPSLKDDEINNKEITSRAIARKRNTYGKALGDVLLPEGQTVPILVEEALTKAFRESGYRVLRPGDDGYGEANAIEADIDQFWAWFSPGFWTITLEFRADVQVKGEIGPFQAGSLVQGSAREGLMAATDDAWREVVEKGVEDLIKNLRAKLESR